jgi:pimeloyl-ACP methyl ester carboxylesterase
VAAADGVAVAVHRWGARSAPLRDITAPTLVPAGEDDPLAVRPQLLASAIPAAELRLVPGNHLSAVGLPAFGAALIQFLVAPEGKRAA